MKKYLLALGLAALATPVHAQQGKPKEQIFAKCMYEITKAAVNAPADVRTGRIRTVIIWCMASEGFDFNPQASISYLGEPPFQQMVSPLPCIHAVNLGHECFVPRAAR
ncbi:MAG: hypothetical protein RL735_720 [Pseudomonadota bacterium]|jgi:hypothetical protein